MFTSAQERFRRGELFSQHNQNGYVRDLLKNYGDNGRKINLPDVSKQHYEQGISYRNKEKTYYKQLEDRLRHSEDAVMKERSANKKDRDELYTLANFINSIEFLVDDRDGDGDNARGERSVDNDSRSGVLSTEDPARKAHVDDGESLVSDLPTTDTRDERTDGRRDSARGRTRDELKEGQSSYRSSSSGGAGAGGSSDGQTDVSESNTRGPAGADSA